MVIITAPEFDPEGILIIMKLASGSDVDSLTRRTQRTATLDGAAVIVDHGFSDADRTLTVTLTAATLAQLRTAQRLVRLYPRVIVSARGGVFSGSMNLRAQNSALTLQIQISERLSA